MTREQTTTVDVTALVSVVRVAKDRCTGIAAREGALS
jgi:hypothetical protein